MSKHIAVVLSGCGVFDGSEIYEAVLTFLRLSHHGASYQCFAPDIKQHHVINHLSGEEMTGERNVLIEAARLARGEIKNISQLNVSDMDGIILPGGFGAAKNLSDFALKGENLTVNPDVSAAVKAFHQADKPVGMICIAPAMAGVIFGRGVKCTIGNDAETVQTIEKTGAVHVECEADQIVTDEANRLVTTPAYMRGQSITEVNKGISKLVDRVLEMA